MISCYENYGLSGIESKEARVFVNILASLLSSINASLISPNQLPPPTVKTPVSKPKSLGSHMTISGKYVTSSRMEN